MLVDEVENWVSDRNIILFSYVPLLVCLPDPIIDFLNVHQNSPPLASKLTAGKAQPLVLIESFRQKHIDNALFVAYVDFFHYAQFPQLQLTIVADRYRVGVFDMGHITQKHSNLVPARWRDAIVQINKKHSILAIDVANATVASLVDMIVVVEWEGGDL